MGGEPGHIHVALLLDDLPAHAPNEIVGEAIALVKEYADILAILWNHHCSWGSIFVHFVDYLYQRIYFSTNVSQSIELSCI